LVTITQERFLFSSKYFLGGLLGAGLVVLFLAWSPHDATSNNNLDVLDKGPVIGASLPHPLTVADQFNEVRDFASLKRKRGLILLFSRSFDW
jgi:hypothetical protein